MAKLLPEKRCNRGEQLNVSVRVNRCEEFRHFSFLDLSQGNHITGVAAASEFIARMPRLLGGLVSQPGGVSTPCAAFLEVPEHVSDVLSRLFSGIHGHLLAFLSASCRVARDIFACVNWHGPQRRRLPSCHRGSLGPPSLNPYPRPPPYPPSYGLSYRRPIRPNEPSYLYPLPTVWTITCPPSFPSRSDPFTASLRPWTVVLLVNVTVSMVPSEVFTVIIFAP